MLEVGSRSTLQVQDTLVVSSKAPKYIADELPVQPPLAPRINRYEYLDALRGIAILGVILVHCTLLSQQEDLLLQIGCSGQRGVQLFYIVSAFTLFLTLESRVAESSRWANFYIRRFCRIAPMFYLASIAKWLFFGRAVMAEHTLQLSWPEVASGLLFLHGWSWRTINSVALGGWSVGVEASFYLLVPLLFAYVNSIRKALVLFIASTVVLQKLSLYLAVQPGSFKHPLYFSFLWFPAEFPIFCLGVLAYLIWKEYVRHWVESNKTSAKELSRVLIFVSALFYIANLPYGTLDLYLSSFAFVPLVLGLSLDPWKLFVNRFTIFMGKISYSVYLFHFLVLEGVTRLLLAVDNGPAHIVSQYVYTRPMGLVVTYLLVFGISVPVCWLTWRFVEEPGIRAGRNWIKRKQPSRESTVRTSQLIRDTV